MNDLDMGTIKICLEQRNIFMAKLLDMTKQLQVKSQQEDIDFDNLLDRRQDCMDRIDKCNQMIQTDLSMIDHETASKIISILANEKLKLPCSPTLQKLYELVVQYNELLQRTLGLDQTVTQEVTTRHSDLKDKINHIRKQQKQR